MAKDESLDSLLLLLGPRWAFSSIVGLPSVFTFTTFLPGILTCLIMLRSFATESYISKFFSDDAPLALCSKACNLYPQPTARFGAFRAPSSSFSVLRSRLSFSATSLANSSWMLSFSCFSFSISEAARRFLTVSSASESRTELDRWILSRRFWSRVRNRSTIILIAVRSFSMRLKSKDFCSRSSL